ncbi:MAG: hypothetical protein OHK0046_08060 [Anaerolineae bacterium]
MSDSSQHPTLTAALATAERARVANLLKTILTFLLAMVPVYLFLAVTIYQVDMVPLVGSLLIGPVFLLVRWLVYRGVVWSVGWLLCAAIWISIWLSNRAFGGLVDPSFAYFFFPIVLAGLIFGGPAALAITALSLTMGFVEVVRTGFVNPQISIWVSHFLMFVLLAFMMWLAHRNSQRTLYHSMLSQQRTQELNQSLQAEINEHRQTSHALQRTEGQYKSLLEMLPMTVSVIDQETLDVLYVNPFGLESIRAPGLEAAVGKSATEFVGEGYLDFVIERIRTVLVSDTPVIAPDWLLQRQDGTAFSVDSVSVKVMFAGRPAILSAYTDIGERKALHETMLQNERIKAELEQERATIQARESVLNTASHQMRTPLTIILASADMLAEYGQRLTAEKHTEHLHKVRSQAMYMRALLEDLLLINKASAGKLEFKPEPLPLNAFCTRLINDFALSVDTHTFSFSGELAGIFWLDSKLMTHILYNLLSNAVKYSPEGSRVEVTLDKKEQQAVLKVRDYGIGVVPQDRERLFETFFRGSNVRHIQGTGLGLSIVKNSAEAQGGHISVESQPGMGTTFTVELPLASAEARTAGA